MTADAPSKLAGGAPLPRVKESISGSIPGRVARISNKSYEHIKNKCRVMEPKADHGTKRRRPSAESFMWGSAKRNGSGTGLWPTE